MLLFGVRGWEGGTDVGAGGCAVSCMCVTVWCERVGGRDRGVQTVVH